MRRFFDHLFNMILLSGSSLLLFSCSADISREDEALRKLLIGTFYSENYQSITFSKDGTFIDTLWSRVPYSNTKELVPVYAAEGNYSVINGVINFSEVYFTYVRASFDPSAETFTETFFPKTIRQDYDDIFFIQTFTELSGEGDSLHGEWSTENWTAAFEKNGDAEFNGGMVRESFNFAGSNLCEYSSEFLFASSISDTAFTTKYDYDHPRIYFHAPELEIPTFRGSLIQFRNGRMFWYHSDPILFKKIK